MHAPQRRIPVLGCAHVQHVAFCSCRLPMTDLQTSCIQNCCHSRCSCSGALRTFGSVTNDTSLLTDFLPALGQNFRKRFVSLRRRRRHRQAAPFRRSTRTAPLRLRRCGLLPRALLVIMRTYYVLPQRPAVGSVGGGPTTGVCWLPPCKSLPTYFFPPAPPCQYPLLRSAVNTCQAMSRTYRCHQICCCTVPQGTET